MWSDGSADQGVLGVVMPLPRQASGAGTKITDLEASIVRARDFSMNISASPHFTGEETEAQRG